MGVCQGGLKEERSKSKAERGLRLKALEDLDAGRTQDPFVAKELSKLRVEERNQALALNRLLGTNISVQRVKLTSTSEFAEDEQDVKTECLIIERVALAKIAREVRKLQVKRRAQRAHQEASAWQAPRSQGDSPTPLFVPVASSALATAEMQ